jgi:hypothetical protein
MPRRWVSLGGWCGPSLILSKLGLRGGFAELPYDMVRCTMDGLVQFTRDGFDGYFPSATEEPDVKAAAAAPWLAASADPRGLRIPMDPVSIWLLFRGSDTVFTHFDLNSPSVRRMLQQRLDGWSRMMDEARQGAHPPVTFLRTCLAENPADELRTIGAFQAAVDEITNGKLDHRLVLALHNQGPTTEYLGTAGDHDRCVVWNLAFDATKPASASLFDRTHDGYEHIVQTCGDDATFRTLVRRPVAKTTFSPQGHLARVEGVAAFRGTCVGFGSTVTASSGVCMACGSADGHRLMDPSAFDSGKTWTEDEDAQLLATFAQHDLDLVGLVEHLAQQFHRSANEVHRRLIHLAHTAMEG